MTKQGMVTDLYVYEQKGVRGIAVFQIACQAEKGITGDVHAAGGERQIAIQTKELKDWIAKGDKQGLCVQKFKANIVIEGLNFEVLKSDSLLNVAGTKLKITSGLKKCYPNECEIFDEKKTCRMLNECTFARVLNTGTIAVGDKVEIFTNKRK